MLEAESSNDFMKDQNISKWMEQGGATLHDMSISPAHSSPSRSHLARQSSGHSIAAHMKRHPEGSADLDEQFDLQGDRLLAPA